MHWSYSSCGCYHQCPAKYKYRYRDNIRGTLPQHPAASRGTEIHAHFEHCLRDCEYHLPNEFSYYNDFVTTLREHKAQAEVEISLNKEWRLIQPWDDVWVVSVLDVSLIEDTVGRNYDWKTGKIYPEHGDQRELYSLLQFCAYPQLERVIGMHVYVDLRQNRTSEYIRDDVPALKAKWEEKAHYLFEDEIFPPNPSFACTSCEYSRYNGGPCRF